MNTGGEVFNRDSLCVDLFTDIQAGVTYVTSILRPDQVTGKNMQRVSWLVDNALLPTQDNDYISLLDPANWVHNAAQGAGIQLAIWDIVHDNGNGFSAGSVQAAATLGVTDPSVLAWAQTYEALSKYQHSDLAYIYNNVVLGTNTPVQMLAGPIFVDGGPAPAPAPEPATFWLAAITLIGLVCFACRRYAAK